MQTAPPGRDDIGAGPNESIEVALWFDNHQVHIERLLRVASDRFDNHRPKRDVRHETTIHHVDMNPVGAGRIDGVPPRRDGQNPQTGSTAQR